MLRIHEGQKRNELVCVGTVYATGSLLPLSKYVISQTAVATAENAFFFFYALDISIRNAGGDEGLEREQNVMKQKHTEHLLAGLPLGSCDAARLVLEAVEEMPELAVAAKQGKVELMQALRRVLRAGIVAVREQEHTVSFRAAAEESLARRAAAGRRPTTLRDLRHFLNRLLRVPGLAERPLRSMGVQECRRALEQAFARSSHSFRKGRAIMHSIFAYGQRQQWCSHNPVAAIEVPRLEEKEIVPLTLEECRRLVEVAKTPDFRDCLPALGLMLFAGVRPGEVERLSWADVHCREGVLAIAACHSKTGARGG